MTRKENIIQFVKFTGFSISAGIIEIGAFTIFFKLIHFEEDTSYLIGLILSVLWNFTVNRRFTFKSANNVPIAMTKIFIFYLIFTPLSTWWVEVFTSLGINVFIVVGVTMIINFITEFLYSRVFIYRNQMNTRLPSQNRTI